MLPLLRASLQKLSAHGAFDVGEAGTHNNQTNGALDCFTRTTRRSVLYALGAGAVGKPNIASFGKVFAYLKDPALRSKEVGDAVLTVEGAEFSGERFEGMEWRNIVFKNCDFIGGYEIAPKTAKTLRYEDCRFSGILSFGVTDDVRFVRCGWAGASVMFAEKGSRNTTFEACKFVGTSAEPNQQGTVGSEGEARYIGCQAKWFNWAGDAALAITDCECEGVSIHTDSLGNSGPRYLSSVVTISNSKLRGLFDMRGNNLQSLAIRDTQIDNLDLSSVTVKGDVVMERVKGLKMNLALASAGAVDLKEVQISGSGPKVFYLAANRCRSVLLENCKLPSNPGDEKAWIGGAEKEPAYKVRPPISQSVTLRRSRLPELDLSYLNTARLSIDNCELDRVDISNGSIGAIELLNTNFSFTLDLSNTHASSFKQTGGTNLSKLGGLKLDGSNVKVN